MQQPQKLSWTPGHWKIRPNVEFVSYYFELLFCILYVANLRPKREPKAFHSQQSTQFLDLGAHWVEGLQSLACGERNINFTNFHSHFLIATFFITSRVVNSRARCGIYEPFEWALVQPVSSRNFLRNSQRKRERNPKITTFAFACRVTRYSLEIRDVLRLHSKGLS